VLEQVTVYGLLMVMRFSTLDQCITHAEKLYGAEGSNCFEIHETVLAFNPPPERPSIFWKETR
jgi:hypothetical protein